MKFLNVFKPIVCIVFVLVSASIGHTQTRGTIDGGGANGLNSKIIESYKVSSDSLPQSKYISPFLKFLRKSTFNGKINFNMSSYEMAIENILKKKMWYLVPVEDGIENLGKQVHGIPFITDQFAIQTKNEVFINKNVYDQMTGDLSLEREKLVLHEIFMGLKVLLKQDFYTQCLFSGTSPDSVQTTDYCFDGNRDQIKETTVLNLTKEEHSEVRYLTDLVIQNVDNFSRDEKYQDLLVTFINAFYQRNFVSEKLRVYKSGNEKVAIEKIANVIKGKEVLKENTLYCGHTQWNNYSESKLEELQQKWNSLPKGTKWMFKAKYKVKLITTKKDNQIFIKLIDSNGKTIKETVHANDSQVVGFPITSEFNKSILSRDEKFVEYSLIETDGPGYKIGNKVEGVIIELNLENGEIKKYHVFDKITYSVSQNGASSRWITKVECINQETLTYTK